MASCKDCVYVDICDFSAGLDEPVCGHFKDCARFIELPCKVDDIVYEPVRGQISEFVVDSFGFDGEKVWLNLKCIKGLVSRNVVGVNDIGKSVFLSKIEAEKSSGFCKPTFTI